MGGKTVELMVVFWSSFPFSGKRPSTSGYSCGHVNQAGEESIFLLHPATIKKESPFVAVGSVGGAWD